MTGIDPRGRQSHAIVTMPAQAIHDLQAGPVMIEIHNNGYAYIRQIEVTDLPGYNNTKSKVKEEK